MRNWCHQDLPSGAYELLIVNPQSPDGTHEHLAAVSRSYPDIRVREIAVGSRVTNKGAMINKALADSHGEWIWLTDADCLFAPNCLATVLEQIDGLSDQLFYGQRRYLSATQTDGLLAGRVDGLRDFAELAQAAMLRPPENSPWGYTQIAHRSTFEKVRYREEFNHFAHSDGIFVEDCKRHSITARQVEGLVCLHLDHPFSWYGTNTFL
jgi:glycosyltransferase involved in cell wall biosynthesis